MWNGRYLQVAVGVLRRIGVVKRQITNTEELVLIHLDTTRNRILTFGFALNIIMVRDLESCRVN